MLMNKEEIRPMYSEFQGYLFQTPKPKDVSEIFSDDAIWKQYNEAVKELEKISNENYKRFYIKPDRESNYDIVRVASLRSILGGLISRLHSKYFSDEQAPFDGMPSTVITQTQTQNQSVQMFLDFNNKINDKLNTAEGGSEEKDFLEKFRSKLGTATSISEIFKLCFQLAKNCGIGVAALLKLFS